MDHTRKTRWPVAPIRGFEAAKAEEYAYWQSRPAYERANAASRLSADQYAMKDPNAHVSRLRRVSAVLKR
jgi:hypothetical protein